MAKKKIEFMDTSFRDGFQSVFGARVATKDFLPALEAAVDAGCSILKLEAGLVSKACSFIAMNLLLT